MGDSWSRGQARVLQRMARSRGVQPVRARGKATGSQGRTHHQELEGTSTVHTGLGLMPIPPVSLERSNPQVSGGVPSGIASVVAKQEPCNEMSRLTTFKKRS